MARRGDEIPEGLGGSATSLNLKGDGVLCL